MLETCEDYDPVSIVPPYDTIRNLWPESVPCPSHSRSRLKWDFRWSWKGRSRKIMQVHSHTLDHPSSTALQGRRSCSHATRRRSKTSFNTESVPTSDYSIWIHNLQQYFSYYQTQCETGVRDLNREYACWQVKHLLQTKCFWVRDIFVSRNPTQMRMNVDNVDIIRRPSEERWKPLLHMIW